MSVRYPVFVLVTLLAGFSRPARAQYSVWQASPAGATTACADAATDAAGNTYLVGYLCGQTTFDSITVQAGGFTPNFGCSGGSSFVAKIDGAGRWQWVRLLPKFPHRLAIDTSGHVFVAGNFSDTITAGSRSLISKGGTDVFVARLAANSGNLEWLVGAGGATDDYLSDLVLSPAGIVYVAGHYTSDSLVIGPTVLTDPRPGGEGQSLLVARLTPAGTWLGASSAQSPTLDEGWHQPGGWPYLAVDASGDAYLSGPGGDSLARFGSIVLPGRSGGFVACLSATSHTWQWVQPLPRVAGTELVAADGRLYLTGLFTDSTLTLGGTTLTHSAYPAPGPNLSLVPNQLVARLDAGSGAWEWVVGVGQATTSGLAVDATGALYLTGQLHGPAMFGAATLPGPLGSVSHTSLFVASLSEGGAGRWAVQDSATTRGSSGGAGIGLDRFGHTYVAGFQDYTWVLCGSPPSTALVARVQPGSALELARQETANSFTLAPNPAATTVRLVGVGAGEVQVMNALGWVVRKVDRGQRTSSLELDLRGLPAGLYTVWCGGVARKLVVE